MKITFAQGWSARPFKEQFPELTDIEAQKLDKVNEAITRLYLDDMLTDDARVETWRAALAAQAKQGEQS